MYRFRVSLHALPADLPLERIELKGVDVESLHVAASQLAQASFTCTFEAAADRLAKLPRMFIEPDGSFVWVSGDAQPVWQVDGNLYDRAGRLQFVDLQGTSTPECFEEFLAALGWPQQQLAFLLTREGIALDEQAFLAWADSEYRAMTSPAARPK